MVKLPALGGNIRNHGWGTRAAIREIWAFAASATYAG